MNKKAKDILDFWFIESSPKEKFNRNDEFDKKIRERGVNTTDKNPSQS